MPEVAFVAAALTPLGEMYMAAAESGIVGSTFGSKEDAVEEMGLLGYELHPVPSNPASPAERLATEGAVQVEDFFAGTRKQFDLPLDFGMQTDFGRAVLEEVAFRVPFGTTATYGEIGERAGRPRSARAVGNIMAGCPFSIIVPCHRIIHASGAGGTRWDRGFGHRKLWLLSYEAQVTAGQPADLLK